MTQEWNTREEVGYNVYRVSAVGDTLLSRSMTIEQARAYVEQRKIQDKRNHNRYTYVIETRTTITTAQEKR